MLFFRNARARNTHVEATLNHPCAAQVGAVDYVVAGELSFDGIAYADAVAAPEATRNTTEFFRDKWADGRNTVRAIANASRMVGSSKKLGA